MTTEELVTRAQALKAQLDQSQQEAADLRKKVLTPDQERVLDAILPPLPSLSA